MHERFQFKPGAEFVYFGNFAKGKLARKNNARRALFLPEFCGVFVGGVRLRGNVQRKPRRNAPRKGERVNMANPAESFNVDELYSSGVVFSVRQRKYDDNLLLCPLSLAQRLFDRGGQITSLELRLADGADTESVKARLQRALGDRFRVLDRYDQQEDVFRIMNIEKAIAYIFLTFILLVACFNIIGSLSMLIIDKKDDVATLRHMGADDRLIERIFLFEGWLISTLGAVLGIVLGLGLCLAQQHFGLLKLGQSSGNFIIDAYPVSVRATDVVAVFVTVALVSFAAIWYPVRRLTRRLL